MKIAFIAKKINIQGGGSNHSLDLLARELEVRGHNVRIITIHSKKNRLAKSRPYDVIERTDLPTPTGSASLVHSILNKYENEVDIFHIFSPGLITGAGVYKKFGGKAPVVARLNNYLFCTNPGIMDDECYKSCTTRAKFAHDNSSIVKKVLATPYYRFRTTQYPKLVNEIDKSFALSPTVKDIYEGIGVSPEKITVISNFYDTTIKSDDVYWRKNTNDATKLVYVGRLEEQKGIHVLLDAIALLLKSGVSVEAEIVGGGDDKQRLINQSNQLDIQDVVEFHGHVKYDNLYQFYADAEIFVHPALWPEPAGRTILEAMQYRCVPVVSDIGGPPWIAGDAGITFEPNNPVELKKKVESLICNDKMYQACVEQCDSRLKHFSKDQILPQLESEYGALLNH